MIHSSYLEELDGLLRRISEDPQRQGLCAKGKVLEGETEREELYLDFSYQKLDEVGFALTCFEYLRALEELRFSAEEWESLKHSFVLGSLVVSGGRPTREETIKKAYESIKEMLTRCVGISCNSRRIGQTDEEKEARKNKTALS